jgi:large subunit ribosomal protein L22
MTSYQGTTENIARANGIGLPISTKVSYEIANVIRGKTAAKAVAFLQNVIAMDVAVPYKRFNADVGHKPGHMAAGRYPIKASTNFLKVLNGAISNAKDKGLDESALRVVHVASNQGPAQWHYGRQRRRQMKSTHLEIVVAQVSAPAKPKVKKAPAPKVEAKPVEAKAETTEAPVAKEETSQ